MDSDDGKVFNEVTAVKVDLTRHALSDLHALAAELGLSRTDAVNRAITLYLAALNAEPGQILSFDHPGGPDRVFLRMAIR